MSAPKKKSKAHDAIVVAPAAPLLSNEQRELLPEALRLAEQTRNVVEDALLEFGRWVLVHVFADDAKAALEQRRDNALWCELLLRAGGPSLRLSRKFLYLAVTFAAHDKRIQDESWRLLEPGRKEFLLPLRDEPLMRKAAQHVIAMKLSQRATKQYVRSVLEAEGIRVKVQTPAPRLEAKVRKFREAVSDPAFQRGLARSLKSLGPEEKSAMKKELEGLRSWANELLAVMRG